MLFALALLLVPVGIILLCQRVPALDKIGVVVLSFGLGIAIAAGVDLSYLGDKEQLQGLQQSISEVSVALALPLLLFSIDIKSAFTMAGDTLKAMAIALLSVVIISMLGALLFKDHIPQIWQVAGMSVGAYTGGGPNMAAIKTAIDGSESVFITMVTYDILFSAIYLLFVISVGKRVFGSFLPAYRTTASSPTQDYAAMEHMSDETANAYKKLVTPNTLMSTLLGLICSGIVVGASLGLASIVPPAYQSTFTIVSITTLGLAASLIPTVRALANSFQLGMYLILVFCFTMGTMTDTRIFTELNLSLAGYISFILIGSLLLQALLCKRMNIDVDTFLITSSAAIMSVPFIPVIAGALKNRAILLPGFAAAIIGYAVGNYLGIIVANLTKVLIP